MRPHPRWRDYLPVRRRCYDRGQQTGGTWEQLEDRGYICPYRFGIVECPEIIALGWEYLGNVG